MRLSGIGCAFLAIAILVTFAIGTWISSLGMKYFFFIIACVLFGILVGSEEQQSDEADCSVCRGHFHESEGGWACIKCLLDIKQRYIKRKEVVRHGKSFRKSKKA